MRVGAGGVARSGGGEGDNGSVHLLFTWQGLSFGCMLPACLQGRGGGGAQKEKARTMGDKQGSTIVSCDVFLVVECGVVWCGVEVSCGVWCSVEGPCLSRWIPMFFSVFLCSVFAGTGLRGGSRIGWSLVGVREEKGWERCGVSLDAFLVHAR